MSLPINTAIPDVVASLRSNRALVLVAPPGAGKTTRIPPAIVDAGLLDPAHPALVLLQPRRVAARAAAERMASERGGQVGDEVGYQIRMERRIGPRTRIRVLTEGILTRGLLADPFLEGIGAVVLDEFHERSLHIDLALAMLREIRQSVRDDLIVVVMSATLRAEPVAEFLGECPVIRVQGRGHPVEVSYHPSPPKQPLHQRASDAVVRSLGSSDDPGGDVLVFLPGVDEIRRAGRELAPMADRDGLLVLPLHGSLPGDQQDRALRPADRRKIVLATNVAETSLTIDGIRTVIDVGYARFASIDAARGLERLELGRISRNSADQRAGRAGRTAPGRCLRLWSREEHRGLLESDPPEVRVADLASTILAIHAWGQADPLKFGWFEPPPEANLAAAERLLEALGAIERGNGHISPIGRRLLDLPLHPRLARLLLAAEDAGCVWEGASLAALISEKDILRIADDAPRRPPDPHRGRSDLLVRLDALEEAEHARFAPRLRELGIDPIAARRVAEVRNELLRLVSRRGRNDGEIDEDALLRLLLLAYPDRVCRRRRPGDPSARMVGGRGVRLDPSSVVREPEFFLAIDPKEDRRGRALEARVRIASGIEPAWIEEHFADRVESLSEARFDESRERVSGFATVRYRDLTLRESPHGAVDPDLAGLVLAEALRPRALEFLREDAAIASWLGRYEFLREHMPEIEWPAIDPEEILFDACSGKKSIAEARSAPIVSFLRGRLTHQLGRILDSEAPESLLVPSGNRIKLAYEQDRPPVLAVRIQELFGLADTPRLAGGRVAVVVHLLGPNYRPVQITDDLRSFWASTYFQVRKDLRARYPRHSWPDDPLSAKPEAKGGRRTT